MKTIHPKIVQWCLILTCSLFGISANANSGFIPLPLITPPPPSYNFSHLDTQSIKDFDKFFNKKNINYVNKNNIIEPSYKNPGKNNPAVVIISEYSPLEQYFYFETLRQLKDSGFYIFLLNVNVSAVKEKSSADFERERESFFNASAQAYLALEMLAEHPAIDPGRIGVFGISAGGVVSRMLMDARVWSALARPNSQPFAVHVDYSDQCHTFFEVFQTTGAPLLTFRSELTAKVDRSRCMESEAQLSQGGSPVDVYGLIKNNAYGDAKTAATPPSEAASKSCLPKNDYQDLAGKVPVSTRLASSDHTEHDEYCVEAYQRKNYSTWQYFYNRKLFQTLDEYLGH